MSRPVPSPSASQTLAGLAQRIAAALQALCEEDGGWAEGPVGVAVSGGGDSMALLLAASVWARTSGRGLAAFSVDHGLRKEAAAEIALAASLARRLGVPHQILRVDAASSPIAGQASARRARYGLLGEALHKVGARCLLTAHTADDQAETVLMRAGAGAPASAMAGMRMIAPLPVWPQGRGAALVRPFLGEPRSALRNMLKDVGIVWAEDPSNADPRHERTRVRTQITAAPALRGHALRLKAMSARRRAMLDASRLGTLQTLRVLPGGVLVLPGLSRLAEDPRRLRSVMMDAVALAGATDERVRVAGLERLLEALREAPARVRSLGGALVWEGPDGLCLSRDPGGMPGPVTLVPGQTAVWDGRVAVTQNLEVSGWTLGPVRPAMPLPEALRKALRRVSPPARGGQAVICDAEGRPVALPLLLPSRSLVATDLVTTRLADLIACLRADLRLQPGPHTLAMP